MRYNLLDHRIRVANLSSAHCHKALQGKIRCSSSIRAQWPPWLSLHHPFRQMLPIWDRAIGLIVAGEVEKASGLQIFDIPSAGPLDGGTEVSFWSGTSGKLSLPLGENLSIQNDFDIEYNDQAFDSGTNEGGLRYGFLGASHLSWRNPDQALFVSDGLPQTGRVMVKDEDLCVHCGLCAERCPTGAWDMQKSTVLIQYASDEPVTRKRRSTAA